MKYSAVAAAIVLISGQPALAHFQEVLPSAPVVEDNKDRKIELSLVFTHPMEGAPVMDMGQPTAFGVIGRDGARTDLLGTLKPRKVAGKKAYTASYTLGGPANYIFFLEPAPYWEPEEKKMLIHSTKTVVNGFGEDDGWDQLTGAAVEIRPLTRPFALWAGSNFSGIVLYHGQPKPFARIEIEYKNDAHIKAPADAFVTQVMKADAQGYFSYTMPRAGWWGFAALVTGERKMPSPTGETVDVEEGGLIWVKSEPMK